MPTSSCRGASIFKNRYVRAFAYADEVTSSRTDPLLLMELPGEPDHDTFGQNLMYWLDHVNRHLGMMEAMKGQLGLAGSVT